MKAAHEQISDAIIDAVGQMGHRDFLMESWGGDEGIVVAVQDCRSGGTFVYLAGRLLYHVGRHTDPAQQRLARPERTEP